MKEIDDIIDKQLDIEKNNLNGYDSCNNNPRFGEHTKLFSKAWGDIVLNGLEHSMKKQDAELECMSLTQYLDALACGDDELLLHAQERIDKMLMSAGLPYVFEFTKADVKKIKRTLKALYMLQSYIVKRDYPDKEISNIYSVEELYHDEFIEIQALENELEERKHKLFHLKEYLSLCKEIDSHFVKDDNEEEPTEDENNNDN